jgi:hypothetical protein
MSSAAGELAFANRNISSRSASTSLIWRKTGARLDQLRAEGCTRLYRETASGKLAETGGR